MAAFFDYISNTFPVVAAYRLGQKIFTGSSGSDMFDRAIDPTGSEQAFNSAEAEKSRQFNSAEAEKSRQFNSAEAEKQRSYEREMSNTAYQRAVSDMRSAGLNPYMLYGGGSPASTPSAYAASSGAASSGAAHSSGGSTSAFFSNLLGIASRAVMAGQPSVANSALQLLGRTRIYHNGSRDYTDYYEYG